MCLTPIICPSGVLWATAMPSATSTVTKQHREPGAWFPDADRATALLRARAATGLPSAGRRPRDPRAPPPAPQCLSHRPQEAQSRDRRDCPAPPGSSRRAPEPRSLKPGKAKATCQPRPLVVILFKSKIVSKELSFGLHGGNDTGAATNNQPFFPFGCLPGIQSLFTGCGNNVSFPRQNELTNIAPLSTSPFPATYHFYLHLHDSVSHGLFPCICLSVS